MSEDPSLRKIFRDHWERFKRERRPRRVVVQEVEKMLACRDPSRGWVTYRCPKCGMEKPIYLACQSRLCTRCGRRHTNAWAAKLGQELLPENHKHITFTIPQELRQYFYRDRSLLKVLLDAVARSLQRVMRPQVQPGIVAVLHTYGGDLEFKPHVHVLATEGGFDPQGEWREVWYIHYETLRRVYQYELLTALKRKLPLARGLIDQLFREHPWGFYVHIVRNRLEPRDIAGYIGRYVRHPAIAESRIAAYDGQTVTFEYKRQKKTMRRTLPVFDFLEALLGHVPPRHFKLVRYYGLYSRGTRRTAQKAFQLRMALAKALQGDPEEEPVQCPACGCQMVPVMVHYLHRGQMRSVVVEPLYGDMMAISESQSFFPSPAAGPTIPSEPIGSHIFGPPGPKI